MEQASEGEKNLMEQAIVEKNKSLYMNFYRLRNKRPKNQP